MRELTIEDEFEELALPKKKRINSKKKGNRNELECVKIFEKRFGKGFARVPSSGAWGGGANRASRENMSLEQKITLVSDIMAPPNFKFSIEHKAYEEGSFWDLFNEGSDLKKWFKQCSGDASFVGKEPMLIVKYNGKKRIFYIRKKIDNYIFEIDGWYCGWFEELLTLGDDFFYD